MAAYALARERRSTSDGHLGACRGTVFHLWRPLGRWPWNSVPPAAVTGRSSWNGAPPLTVPGTGPIFIATKTKTCGSPASAAVGGTDVLDGTSDPYRSGS